VGGDETEVTEGGLALGVVAAGNLVGKGEADATLDELVGEGEEHGDEEEREKRESEGGEVGVRELDEGVVLLVLVAID
jgi:hypothetical protein